MTTDPEPVPAAPIYSITLTSHGTAQIDGEDIHIAAGADPRLAALAEVRIKAALHGRPVRATAKEPNGTIWPMIVTPVGLVTTLDHPHPLPPGSEPAPAPATPSPHPLPLEEPTPAHAPTPAPPPGRVSPPAYTQLPAPGTPYTGQPLPRWAHTPPPALLRTRPAAAAAAPAPAKPGPPAAETPDAASDWDTPMPTLFRPLLNRLREQETSGDLDGALITADLIESALAALYGDHHPHTVNALSIRAWLAYRRGTDWAEATETTLLAAERRRQANAPEADTKRLTRDAHRAWHRLTIEDPEFALELANRLLELLDHDDKRAKDVISWVESGAARHT